MTEPTPDREVISTAKGLTDALEGMSERLERVDRYGKRSRKWIWFDIVVTVLLAGLGAFTWYLSVQSTDAVRSAQRASASAAQVRVIESELHQSLLTGCASGNSTRTAERTLWAHIYRIGTSSGHPTAQEIAKDKALLAYIDRKFASRDCLKAYPYPRKESSP